MYMIAALCMLEIYQIRHPDINAHSHIAYAVMAFVILIAVIGVVSKRVTIDWSGCLQKGRAPKAPRMLEMASLCSFNRGGAALLHCVLDRAI